MEFRRGVTMIDPAAADQIVAAAAHADLPVFTLMTGGLAGRAAFFEAVRAAIPLDPPVPTSRSWEALADSAWEGLRNLEASNIVILWPDATAFVEDADSEYGLAMSVLRDLAESLADSRSTSGRPKEVSIFVGTR